MAFHVNEIGKEIVLNVVTNIDGATVMRIYYEKPDGTTRGYWTAVKKSSTSISYTTLLVTDLDQRGKWTLHAYVVTPSFSLPGEEVFVNVRQTVRAFIEGLIA